MSETREQAQTSTSLYEQLRDGLDGEAGISWRDGDRWSSYLREKFEALEADEKLSEEGRYEAAEEYLKKTRPRIESAYETARKHLEAEAKRKERASIPLPDKRDLATHKVADETALLAIQGEAQAIISRVERARERLPQGLRGDRTTDLLRDAYASALEDGGVEGMARARGTLKAAEQLGISAEELVAPFMEQRHYEAADEARRLEYLRQQVPSGKSLPANPFSPAQTSRSGSDLHTARSKAFLKPGTPQVVAGKGSRGRRQQNPWAR